MSAETATDDREKNARNAFEEALVVYLALPVNAYGRLVLHFGSGGQIKSGGVEAQLDLRPPVAR
jgi:hypothetical protein